MTKNKNETEKQKFLLKAQASLVVLYQPGIFLLMFSCWPCLWTIENFQAKIPCFT